MSSHPNGVGTDTKPSREELCRVAQLQRSGSRLFGSIDETLVDTERLLTHPLAKIDGCTEKPIPGEFRTVRVDHVGGRVHVDSYYPDDVFKLLALSYQPATA